MRGIDLAVIHCSATKQGVDYDVATIRKWHLKRGFKDIGYHFLIHLDGMIERGRPWDQPGAHAKGYNSNSIGICYVGGTDGMGRPTDTRRITRLKRWWNRDESESPNLCGFGRHQDRD